MPRRDPRHVSPTENANEVIRHLVAAAECMLLPTTERKAAATIHAAMALLKIAQSDPNMTALDLTLKILGDVKDGTHEVPTAEHPAG